MSTSICQWITSFLTDRQQLVKLGKYTSSTRTISTGDPQGCVLSPLLFSLYTNDCTSKNPSVKLLKLADDTTRIGLIQDGDESAYRQEVKELVVWCSLNNLELNTFKTVEMIVDFRRTPPPPLTIMNSTTVESFRFLVTTISQDLKWDNHIDSYSGKGPAEAVLPSPAEEVQPATGAAETVLICYHWIRPLHFNNCLVQLSYKIWTQKTTSDRHRIVRTAERIIGTTLPTLQELYLSRVSKRADKITLDPSHPAHSLFEPLPSGQRYRALSTRTTRHRNSFFPLAIHLRNTWQ